MADDTPEPGAGLPRGTTLPRLDADAVAGVPAPAPSPVLVLEGEQPGTTKSADPSSTPGGDPGVAGNAARNAAGLADPGRPADAADWADPALRTAGPEPTGPTDATGVPEATDPTEATDATGPTDATGNQARPDRPGPAEASPPSHRRTGAVIGGGAALAALVTVIVAFVPGPGDDGKPADDSTTQASGALTLTTPSAAPSTSLNPSTAPSTTPGKEPSSGPSPSTGPTREGEPEDRAAPGVPKPETGHVTSTKGTTKATTKAAGQATVRKASTSTPAGRKDWETLVINGTSVLRPGQSWRTNRIRLTLTGSGDVTLTDENGKVTWSSGTSGADELVFQADGNLVLYDGGETRWSTRTDGHDNAILTLQADGNVTIALNNQTLWSALQ